MGEALAQLQSTDMFGILSNVSRYYSQFRIKAARGVLPKISPVGSPIEMSG